MPIIANGDSPEPTGATQALITGQSKAGGSSKTEGSNNACALYVAISVPQTTAEAAGGVEPGPVIARSDGRRGLVWAGADIGGRSRRGPCCNRGQSEHQFLHCQFLRL